MKVETNNVGRHIFLNFQNLLNLWTFMLSFRFEKKLLIFSLPFPSRDLFSPQNFPLPRFLNSWSSCRTSFSLVSAFFMPYSLLLNYPKCLWLGYLSTVVAVFGETFVKKSGLPFWNFSSFNFANFIRLFIWWTFVLMFLVDRYLYDLKM